MKTKQNIFKAMASLAFAFGAFASAQAQSNLGAACGCPPVASRPEIWLQVYQDTRLYLAHLVEN